MLDFAIFAVTIIVLLLSLVFYLYPGSRKQTTVPGLNPSHHVEGNIPDIIKAGSFYQFLDQLHIKHGKIASFWLYGPSLAVSIASSKTIQELDYLFEKPSTLLTQFESFVGEKSILLAKKNQARKQRTIWEEMFQKSRCDAIKDEINKLTSELVMKWSSLASEQHIPLAQYMKAFSLKIALFVAFGDYFRSKNSDMISFSRSFEICWKELEARSRGDVETQEGHRSESFKQAIAQLRQLMMKCLDESDDCPSKSVLHPLISDNNLSEEHIMDELMTYLLKHYSISSSLLWSIYLLASNELLQDQLYESLQAKEVNLLEKVIKAILMTANVEQWTARINEDVDMEIEGHVIPKSTPIIFKLAHSSEDMKAQFEECLQMKDKDMLGMWFGSDKSKRCCPARYYSLIIMRLFISQIITHFKVHLVNGDFDAIPVYYVYSQSEEEIWITIEKR